MVDPGSPPTARLDPPLPRRSHGVGQWPSRHEDRPGDAHVHDVGLGDVVDQREADALDLNGDLLVDSLQLHCRRGAGCQGLPQRGGRSTYRPYNTPGGSSGGSTEVIISSGTMKSNRHHDGAGPERSSHSGIGIVTLPDTHIVPRGNVKERCSSRMNIYLTATSPETITHGVVSLHDHEG